MLSTLASNAILSKARAMYGKRLTEKEYKDLLHCKTVGEIAAYLKQRTAYGPILTGVNEKEVHRGQLEALLHKKLFYDFAALCRYEITVGEHFADYLLARSEIDQILHSLMLLMGGRSSDYLFSMPLFLDAHTHINLTALSQTKSYDDFLSALSGTPYQSLLSPFRPKPGKPLDMAAIENALSGFLYNRVFETVRKHSRGKAREELLYLFQTYIDFSNYARIIRMKKYYSMESDVIRSLLLPHGSLTPRQLDAMLSAKTVAEVKAAMRATSPGKRMRKLEYREIDEVPLRVRLINSKHLIRFSVHPPVVMLAYIFLAENELYNITNIIEGIRYQLPEEEIVDMLIYSKKGKG